MTAINGNALHVTDHDVDALTWEFLTSDDAGDERAEAPLDRRLDRFLRGHGLGRLADSDDIRKILLRRAMTYIRVPAPQHTQPPPLKCTPVYRPLVQRR
jgi:hypothetical protein